MSDPRARVLLLDDEENVRLSLAMLLEDEGYDVVEAASVPEARAALAESPLFDVAILDRRVGPDRGTDLIPEIRRAAPAAAIIVLSGSTSAEEVPGADVVIDKLDSPREVLARLDAFLAIRHGGSQ